MEQKHNEICMVAVASNMPQDKNASDSDANISESHSLTRYQIMGYGVEIILMLLLLSSLLHCLKNRLWHEGYTEDGICGLLKAVVRRQACSSAQYVNDKLLQAQHIFMGPMAYSGQLSENSLLAHINGPNRGKVFKVLITLCLHILTGPTVVVIFSFLEF